MATLLTADQITIIRIWHKDVCSNIRTLSEMFNMSESAISRMVKGESHKNIPPLTEFTTNYYILPSGKLWSKTSNKLLSPKKILKDGTEKYRVKLEDTVTKTYVTSEYLKTLVDA